MADAVIVVGSKRGRETVPAAEIRQMCVSVDTPVFVAGQRSFAKKASDVGVGEMVVGLDASTMRTVGASVVRVFRSKGLVKRVCFSNGSELVCSHHPLKSWDGGWIDSDDLRVGDRVCVVAASEHQRGLLSLQEKIESVVRGLDVYCRVEGKDLCRLRSLAKADVARMCGIKEVSVSKVKATGVMRIGVASRMGFGLRYLRSKNGSEMDMQMLRYEDLPWALGMLASDGNVRCDKERTLFRIALRNKEMVARFAEIFRAFGFDNVKMGRRMVEGKGEMWECVVSSFVFVRILVALGITPRKSRSLDLSALMDLEARDKMGFLSGMVDGDGHVDGKSDKVRICTASRMAAYGMRDMFLSSGIYSIVGKFSGSGSVFGYPCDTTHYVVTVGRKDDVARFAGECGMSFKLPKNVSVKRQTRPLKGGCCWTKVVSVEGLGEQDLVNFSVAGCESFVCDGIVTHNCGRAGRRHGGAECEAYVLVDSEDYAEVEEGMSGDAKFEVSSSMVSCDDLVFHLMPGICSGSICDEAGAEAWYSRGFGAAQGRRPSFKKAFERLVECGAVEFTPVGYAPTPLAGVASELYFHPADVNAWRENFGELFGMGLEMDDAALALALGSVPFMDSPGDFGDHRFVMGMFKEALPGELTAAEGMVAKSTLWWSALGCQPVGRMRNKVLELKADVGRVAKALARLDDAEGWGRKSFFREMEDRVRRGIPSHLAALCGIDGMTKSRADFLYNLGVKDASGVKEVVSSLDGEVDEDFMGLLRRVANGFR